jgi:hypothetical protein
MAKWRLEGILRRNSYVKLELLTSVRSWWRLNYNRDLLQLFIPIHENFVEVSETVDLFELEGGAAEAPVLVVARFPGARCFADQISIIIFDEFHALF